MDGQSPRGAGDELWQWFPDPPRGSDQLRGKVKRWPRLALVSMVPIDNFPLDFWTSSGECPGASPRLRTAVCFSSVLFQPPPPEAL